MAVNSLNGLPTDVMQDSEPQRVRGSANPILTALAKGWLTKGKQTNPMAAALQKFAGGQGGVGLRPESGWVLDLAGQAATGTGLVSQGTFGQGGLDAISSGGLAGGVTSGANAAGGYLTSTGRAAETGFGDSGLGGGLRASDAGPGMTVSDADAIQYSAASDGGTGSATSGGASPNGGSWTGAVTGALAGMGQGEKNYYSDPDMTSKRDGFGTQHPDYRAGIGGGTVGGLLGYYGGSVGSAIAGPVVEWLHPGMEQFTRGLVNTGHSLTGDSTGAMLLDPIGTPASGKYSNHDIEQDRLNLQKKLLLGGLAEYL